MDKEITIAEVQDAMRKWADLQIETEITKEAFVKLYDQWEAQQKEMG